MRKKTSFLMIDTTLQTILIILNTLLLVTIIGALILQFFLGLYQLFVSAPIRLLGQEFDEEVTRWRRWHFWGSLIYISCLLTISQQGWGEGFWLIFGFLIPQVFAYAYFMLTLQDHKARREHLSISSGSIQI